MTTPRVLVSDKLSKTAVQIFKDRGVDVDYQPDLGKDKEKLLAIIGDYDGLAIRSATKVTRKLIAAAPKLRVIGRAGIGVDNVDVPAATARGIIVMNTPFGNSITTAEHAIALMFARRPPASRRRRLDPGRQVGEEPLHGRRDHGKTLGIIGCGNIGSIVADRAIGLQMKVIAFDPFLSEERAMQLGVDKVELDELFRRADFITLHTPLTEKTRNIIDAAAIAKMKDGVRIINCARGGLVDEEALAAALKSGKVAGAGVDVFVTEPAEASPLFGLANVVCTPHLGAATTEAQENVAIQVAEQMADYLSTAPSRTPSTCPRSPPRRRRGSSPSSSSPSSSAPSPASSPRRPILGVTIEYAGDVAEMNTKALTAALLAGLLRPILSEVNMVNAPVVARERGIAVDEVRQSQRGAYETYIRLTVQHREAGARRRRHRLLRRPPAHHPDQGHRHGGGLRPHMLYVTNRDKPGFIGRLGTLLGSEKVNIANFNLGRSAPGEDAISLIEIDEPISDAVLARSVRSTASSRRSG